MTDWLSLVVLTPEKTLLEVEAKSIQVLLSDGGSIGILPGHAKLIAATVPGDLSYLDLQDNKLNIKLGGGILSIDNNLIRVMTNTLIDEDEQESGDDNLFDRITREIIIKLKMDLSERQETSNEE